MAKPRKGRRVRIGKEATVGRTAVVEFIRDLEVGAPVDCENLSIFPIYRAAPSRLKIEKLYTLTEALEKGVAEIVDIGVVPKLKVRNKAKDAKILIVEGEILKGGGQNRVANVTLILDENSETVIPVSCVEAHRWGGFQKGFEAYDTYVVPEVYKCMYTSVSASARNSGGTLLASNQSAVWDGIANALNDVHAHSVTGDLGTAYETRRTDIDDVLKKIMARLDKDIIGVIAVIDGKSVYGDISDSREIAEIQIPKALRSYIFAALTSKSPRNQEVEIAAICDMLNKVENANFEENKSIGSGWDVRFNIDPLSGVAVVYISDVVHMTLLAEIGGR